MSPTLSICIPCHDEGFLLLHRTLVNLSAQTCLDFEVVVAVDGPGIFEPPNPLPYSLAVVHSPRTEGNEHLAHRNHARNIAAGTALGSLLWFPPCDFLWDTWLVEHLLGAGHTPVSPVLVDIRNSPARWVEDTDWDDLADTDETQRRLGTLSVMDTTWAGFARRYRRNRGVVVEEQDIPEGFPLLTWEMFQDLGGFDERFLGYGGNNESLTVLLDDYRLLASVRGYHQPHWRPDQEKTLSERNKAMYNAIAAQELMGGRSLDGRVHPT